MKRFLSTFGICLALVEAFLFFGGYQLFRFQPALVFGRRVHRPGSGGAGVHSGSSE